MAADQHIIHRQVLHVQMAKREQALRRQMQLSELCKSVIKERLGAYFDSLPLNGAVLRIPRIEVNLGPIAIEQLDGAFVDLLMRAVEREVDRILANAQLAKDATSFDSQQLEAPAILITENLHLLAVLQQFLSTGTMVPAFRQQSWTTLEERWLQVLGQRAGGASAFFATCFAASPEAIHRLLSHWSAKNLPQLLRLLRKQEGSSNIPPSPQVKFAAAELGTLALYLGWEKEVLLALPPVLLKRLVQLVSQPAGERPAITRTVQRRMQLAILRSLVERPSNTEDFSKPVDELVTLLEQPTHALDADLPAKESVLDEKDAWPAEDTPEGMPLENSGLVLLHAFLPSLFSHLGYLDGDEWVNAQKQERAMHLLHYLATGEVHAPEYQLALPKVLCAWPMNYPVQRELALTEEEQQEADELLGAVLQHWAALKSSSPSVLQDGFLQRPGILHRRDRGWLLQVEHQAMDILLDKLPWGFRLIRLPWLEEEIVVEW